MIVTHHENKIGFSVKIYNQITYLDHIQYNFRDFHILEATYEDCVFKIAIFYFKRKLLFFALEVNCYHLFGFFLVNS